MLKTLTIFYPSAYENIKTYFTYDVNKSLNLINIWWVMSNAKDQCNFSHILGNAVVINEQETHFLRAIGNWMEKWEHKKISNSERLCLSTETSSALRGTLLCYISLVEDL